MKQAAARCAWRAMQGERVYGEEKVLQLEASSHSRAVEEELYGPCITSCGALTQRMYTCRDNDSWCGCYCRRDEDKGTPVPRSGKELM